MSQRGRRFFYSSTNLPQNTRLQLVQRESVDKHPSNYGMMNNNSTNYPRPAQQRPRRQYYPNASLLIQNVNLNDTGFYRLQVITADLVNEEATGQFRVYPELPKPNITSNNSNPVENKDAVALTCDPEIQNTTYLWWVNGQSLLVSPRLQLSSDNRTLTLLSVTRNDTGPYECGIQNSVSANRSDPVTLNVLYGPDAPTISPLDTSYRSGENLNLSCHAASNPPAEYSWLINGTSLQVNTQELFISNITVDHSGSYTCYAQNSATGLNRTTVKIITVSEPPKPYITSNNSNPVENEDAVALTCEAETQNSTYLWWVNGQSLPVSSRLQLSSDNRTLTLLSVTRNDAGTYECGTQNKLSVDRSDPVTLNVLYGPDTPIISPSYTYYHPGASLNLSCHAASNPPAQYAWLIDGSLQQNTGELFVSNITEKNSGLYTCHANNSATGRNRIAVKTITVAAELPKPNITSNNSNPVEDEDAVALTCEPEIQDTTYLWWVNGQSLQVSPRLQLSSDNRTLTLLSVTRNDAGTYECEIQNPVSANRSDAVTLDVRYGPDVPTISPSNSNYRPGENLNLSCHAASSPPAQYSWLIDGTFQQSTQALFIPNITVDHSGSYMCHAHNSATGHNSTTSRIITVSVPDSSPVLSAGTTVSILIGVLASVVLI
uniref:Ig-like domain-containing protein n=1 Tax=Aotus nancymaae TaxID=37293 RepID=A0A2K5C8S7_AOTNA